MAAGGRVGKVKSKAHSQEWLCYGSECEQTVLKGGFSWAGKLPALPRRFAKDEEEKTGNWLDFACTAGNGCATWGWGRWRGG
jgi:hypothetical protein